MPAVPLKSPIFRLLALAVAATAIILIFLRLPAPGDIAEGAGCPAHLSLIIKDKPGMHLKPAKLPRLG